MSNHVRRRGRHAAPRQALPPRTQTALVAGPAGSAAALLMGLLLAPPGAQQPEDRVVAAPAVAAISTAAAGRLQDPRPAASAPSAPVRVEIPAVGVASDLDELGLGQDGRLQAPARFEAAGWYSGGVMPGQVGPAIVAGHVDSATAPAVFARLGELSSGDVIEVTTEAGERLEFEVYESSRSAKADFPTDDVYGATAAPELRLITCDGAFDAASGHYTDNLVVFARLVRQVDAG
ncbi:class F sortase [Herbiconiux sp. SYSU D00978]|uniref:class F sortase n=1 Tax=Herbiconiux sp. SYSU D00978 TaxID=2812562 RepID=UPI001A95BB71|nr:class F sortase [Herbiconiux sp. SYSU D00978]